MWDDHQDTTEALTPHESEAQHASIADTKVGAMQAPEGDGILSMMVQAAQNLQRDKKALIGSARQIGGLLAGDGFYRFPAGGKSIEGPSIDMAEALAQEWGAIVYQVRIVRADPLAAGGLRMHLRASVGDMKSLVCAEVDQVVATASPPGRFATKADQRERWNGMQIQSAASKIVRNAILRVLPKWFVEPAFTAAKLVDSANALGKNPDGSARTLRQAREGAAEALVGFGCTLPELEQYLGQPVDMWAVPQISELRKLYGDLKHGHTSIEAWRVALDEADSEPPSNPTKSALGLPPNGSGKTIDEEGLKAADDRADKLEPEPVTKGKGKGKGKGNPAEPDIATGELTAKEEAKMALADAEKAEGKRGGKS